MVSREQHVQDVLRYVQRHQPCRRTDIASALNMNPHNNFIISEMRNMGLLTQNNGKLYSLTAAGTRRIGAVQPKRATSSVRKTTKPKQRKTVITQDDLDFLQENIKMYDEGVSLTFPLALPRMKEIVKHLKSKMEEAATYFSDEDDQDYIASIDSQLEDLKRIEHKLGI
jgi:hypothetical protein